MRHKILHKVTSKMTFIQFAMSYYKSFRKIFVGVRIKINAQYFYLIGNIETFTKKKIKV